MISSILKYVGVPEATKLTVPHFEGIENIGAGDMNAHKVTAGKMTFPKPMLMYIECDGQYRKVLSDVGGKKMRISNVATHFAPSYTQFPFRYLGHVLETLNPDKWHSCKDYEFYIANIENISIVENKKKDGA